MAVAKLHMLQAMVFRSVALSVVVCAALLAGCGDRMTVGGGPSGTQDATPVAVGPSAKPPPTNLAGRWTLSATGSTSCGMTFGANNPDATEGSIAPGGGCPFNFFTSRKWSYTDAGLTLRDHTAQALAQLTPAGPNRFEGKTGSGQEIALSR
jgi:hypothetical protein